MHWTAGWILSTIFQVAHVVECAREFQPGPDGVIRTEWAIHELQLQQLGRPAPLLQ